MYHHGIQAHFYDDWVVNNPPLVAEVVVFALNWSKLGVKGEKWETIQRFKELWSPTPSSWLAFRKDFVPEYCWESKTSPAMIEINGLDEISEVTYNSNKS